MDKRPPLVSVVMSIYNGEKYLCEAVESILNQTFTDFEFIILDNCSTDGTAEILDRYTDPRIVRIKNEKNIGQAAALNKGMALAKGEYIARMDADDISLPERFHKQIEYLSVHPEVGVLGTRMDVLDEQSHRNPGGFVWHIGLPAEPEVIRWHFFFENVIVPSAVMIRKSLVDSEGGYSDSGEYRHCEDYDLWARLSKVTKIANLEEELFLYRWHDSNESVKGKAVLLESHYKISFGTIKEFAGQHSLTLAILARDYPPGGEEYVYQFTKSVFPLYRGFIKNVMLSQQEKTLIRRDAAKRIFNLANWKRRSPRYWPFFALACWVDPFVIQYAFGLILRRISSISLQTD